ncbi:hypothetical protein GCM10023149_30650 [Mucilaginibacter gynuensis]|uniref:Lipopolysaccharide biosynthesis protein n=1 Tax=Mucilaginibacter gynuensis TaxID=1302236 RepID=A0ABP8GN01_9SPHI
MLGLAWSVFIKTKYTAVCTFVLDESDKEGMLGQYSGLASLAGIDLGGSGGGIFKGDNILELYKSRLMLKKTLLTETVINGKKQKLVDRYITSNRLMEEWKDDHIGPVNFNGDPEHFNRTQDSIITDITEKLNKKNLEVGKPDKKLSIIRVAFTAKDEVFAKLFTDQLVKNVNDFYVQTKTKKAALNVSILQHQADSVKRMLNLSISGVASGIDATPNANPALLILKVPSQRKQVDVQANTAIYSEMIKNLEISKISLRQQTPLIQFIDQPVFPLNDNHLSKLKAIVIGGLLAFVFSVIGLLALRLLRSVIMLSK